jgi:hypothetical protein
MTFPRSFRIIIRNSIHDVKGRSWQSNVDDMIIVILAISDCLPTYRHIRISYRVGICINKQFTGR